jgi:pyruvate dehydrogenase (quinone)
VPPLPPHVTLAQARAFARTLTEGDPKEGSVIANIARQILGEVIPGGKD